MHYPIKLAYLLFLVLLMSASNLWANSCSKSDVVFYLEQGFSHEQVVQLCSNTPDIKQGISHQNSDPASDVNPAQPTTVTPAQQPAASTSTSRPLQKTTVEDTTESSMQSVSQDDLVYFKTAIKSDQVDLTPEHLVYLLTGCIKYGQPDFNGFKEEACVKTRTMIKRQGLRVIKAQKGILLVREPALIVAGDIKREILNIDQLKSKKRKAFLAEYALKPDQLNIPVRSDINPRDVAARLQLIAK